MANHKYSNSILSFLGYWFVCGLAMSYRWFIHTFEHVSIDVILYHLQFGVQLFTKTDPALTFDFLWNAAVVSLPFAIIIFYFFNYHLKKIKYISKACSPMFLLIICLGFISYKLNVIKYIKQQYGADYIAAHYNPMPQITGNKHTKNLILIYVESLENIYSNSNAFGEDLISSLNSIPGQSFTEFSQVPGTGYTIAGMVSTMCAIPLKPLLYPGDHNTLGFIHKKFLPNISCLGDILKNNGYKNVYIGGASLAFAAKGKFLANHGYSEMYGKEEFNALNKKDYTGWGMLDDELFEFAKAKVDELELSGQKYNLTLLTLDMHTPDGYFSEYCTKHNAKEYQDIVRCTSELVYDFVTYLQNKNYLNNTNIVIMGDHLSMRPQTVSVANELSVGRSVFNKFISNDQFPKHRETIVHFDMLPTILNFIGFTVETDRIGLGISGFTQNESIVIDANRTEDMKENILNNSPKYKSFWLSTEEIL